MIRFAKAPMPEFGKDVRKLTAQYDQHCSYISVSKHAYILEGVEFRMQIYILPVDP